MLDFNPFQCLTFDCYGTLIDWESGILQAMETTLAAHGQPCTQDEILELYAELESEAERGEYVTYREILKRVVRGFGYRLGFSPSAQEVESLPESLKNWQPFPDTVSALKSLKTKYKLAVISNIDDDLFPSSARYLQVPFDYVVTAQQAKSYKPSLNNFRLALDRIGLPHNKVLHVAQSLYHDIAPARSLGLSTVWVNRRTGEKGWGATRPATAQPDVEVPDLESLASMALAAG